MQTAKIFKNGQSQAVRLPKEFRFEGKEVYIRRLGNSVILLPKEEPWAVLEESLGEFSDDFLDEERVQPETQTREKAFR
jgi:antitoxin VapB